MTLRRLTPLRASRGTEIPAALRRYVHERDGGCVLRFLLDGHQCSGAVEIDHVRASGALGRKSPTAAWNLVALCGRGHRYKTLHGRALRPLLTDYLARVEPEPS